MSKTKIRMEFNSEGFKQILCSDGVKGAVESAASGIQGRANANMNTESPGFYMHSVLGGRAGRWVAFVGTTDHKSRVAESEYKALSRAVNG